MIVIKNKVDCSGCYACANICTENCLSMIQDDEGFWYPNVDENKCIKCKLCIKVCPIINKNNEVYDIVSFSKKVYAAKNVDDIVRLSSSSGGVFTLLAEKVIESNGIVIGAVFNEKFEVDHQIIESKKDIDKIRGSKYVQSRIGDTLKKVKYELDKKRLVLFTGTPCQISGLKSYLIKDYDNLITQDIICHGVPSPEVWSKYLRYICKGKYKIDSINFRSKKENWRSFSLLFRFDNGKSTAKNIEEDYYLIAFQNNIDLRPSCYDCRFKGEDRVSDFTLADFWGIEDTNIKLDDNKGTSVTIVNSIKGEKLFDEIKKDLIFEETDINTATKNNKNYYVSAGKNILREKFLSEITEENFEYKVREYCNYSYAVEFKNKTKKQIKTILNFLGLIKIAKEIRSNKK